jgi:putative flippase GtrA
MKDARAEAADIGLRGHARRFHIGLRRPDNWLELFRYCTVGASGYIVNLVVFKIALDYLPYLAAFTVAFVIAATSNFVWNRLWAFRVKHGVPHHQYARFLTVSLAALCIDLCVLAFLVEQVGLQKVPAAAIAIIIAIPISFLGNKLWSFR